MKCLPEVCFKPMNNGLDFVTDLDCDPDPDNDPDLDLTDLHEILPKVCLCPRTFPLNCGDDTDYDRDLDETNNFDGGLQSLTA